MTNIPYNRQKIEQDDISAVVEVLESDYLTTGPYVKGFENELVNYTGVNNAVSCCNGTAALHLSMMSLGIGEGDAVIVPAITFLSSANAPRFCGAEVIFCDVDPETGLITSETMEECLANIDIKSNTPKAVVPVHLGGQCCDMKSIGEVAKNNNLKIVEDASHSLGAYYLDGEGSDDYVGNCKYSDLTTFSFHPIKSITTGEGGMISTNDDDLASSLAALRNHGIEKDTINDINLNEPWHYEINKLAPNYRLSDIQCALGMSQIKKLNYFVKRRKQIAELYNSLIAPYQPILKPVKHVEYCYSAWHLYQVLIDFKSLGIERGAVMKTLAEKGIGTQVHYIPVNTQPYYKRRYGVHRLEGADYFYNRTLSLPMYVDLKDSEVHEVVSNLTVILNI